MTAHATADHIQANADAYRVMEPVDKNAAFKAWQSTHAEQRAEREALDAKIDKAVAQTEAMQNRHLEELAELQTRQNRELTIMNEHTQKLVQDRCRVHRNVVRAASQLAAIEQSEGR